METESNNNQQPADSCLVKGSAPTRSDEDLLAEFAMHISAIREKYKSRVEKERTLEDPLHRYSEKMLADLDEMTPEKMLADHRREEQRRIDDERDRQERELARLKHIQDSLWREYIRGRGKRYADCRSSNFEVTCDNQAAAIASLRGYCDAMADNLAEGRNIVLFGPSGTGKDHLLTAVVHTAIASATLQTPLSSMVSVSGPELFATVRRQIGGADGDIIADAQAAWLVVISDLVPPSSKLTDFQSDTVYQIIDRRYNWKRPTFVSINVRNRDELNAALGVAVADRLIHNALTVCCEWPSYRKTGR